MATPELTVDVQADGFSHRPTPVIVFVWVKNESILENLVNRHNRPVDAYRSLLPEALSQGLDVPAYTGERWAKQARWSQKAGCSCPCSPGFKLGARQSNEIRNQLGVDTHTEVFIHVTADVPAVEEVTA